MSPRRDSVYDRFDGDDDGLDAMGRMTYSFVRTFENRIAA